MDQRIGIEVQKKAGPKSRLPVQFPG